MKTRRAIATVMMSAGLVVAAPSGDLARAATYGAEHLPDLQTLQPSDLRIDTSGGQRRLRFSNTVVNLGDGRLELRPQNSGSILNLVLGGSNATRAYQAIYSHDSSGAWYKMREQLVGTFKFHPEHNHWHFEKFAKYELFNVGTDGSVGSSINRVGEKTTFCLIDTVQVDSTMTHAGPQTYTACGQTTTTGISVGWGDRYPYTLDGQWVDVAGVPDGAYWLVSTVNYSNKILEKDGSNNSAKVKIQMSGSSVTAVG